MPRRLAPRDRTPPRHAALWDAFVSFGRSRGVKFTSVDVIYQLGAEFLAEGDHRVNTPKTTGRLAAALRRFVPSKLWSALVKHAGQEAWGRTLVTAEGPRSLSPTRAQAPLPWEACCLLIGQLCLDGHREMGLAVAMAHALRLRAWRLLDCTVGQLTPPLQGDARARQRWCLALHPSEQARRLKVGMGGGSMLIEGSFFIHLTLLRVRQAEFDAQATSVSTSMLQSLLQIQSQQSSRDTRCQQ